MMRKMEGQKVCQAAGKISKGQSSERTGRVWGPTHGRIWPDGAGDGGTQGVTGNTSEK